MQLPWLATLEYKALLEISLLGKLGLVKKPEGFPIFSLRSRTHWHSLKRRGELNVRKLEAL